MRAVLAACACAARCRGLRRGAVARPARGSVPPAPTPARGADSARRAPLGLRLPRGALPPRLLARALPRRRGFASSSWRRRSASARASSSASRLSCDSSSFVQRSSRSGSTSVLDVAALDVGALLAHFDVDRLRARAALPRVTVISLTVRAFQRDLPRAESCLRGASRLPCVRRRKPSSFTFSVLLMTCSGSLNFMPASVELREQLVDGVPSTWPVV